MAATEVKLPGTPKPWMNTAMRAMLGLPVLKRILGGTFAVITVTGAKTGARYTTPVQYLEVDGEYVILSQRHRVWWRNIRTEPDVELSIRGSARQARARIVDGDDATRVLSSCLAGNPRVARFYGIGPSDDGSVDPAAVEAMAERVVVIAVAPV